MATEVTMQLPTFVMVDLSTLRITFARNEHRQYVGMVYTRKDRDYKIMAKEVSANSDAYNAEWEYL